VTKPSAGVKLLLVEDDDALAELTARGFEEAQFVVERCADGAVALERLKSADVDVCVLDARLPSMDGFTVVEKTREAGIETPILMLTARDGLQDRVRGLELGADDYLTKPFAFAELLARVRAISRRAAPKKTTTVFSWGEITLDAVEHRVTRDGAPIELSARQFQLLLALLRHGREIVTRSMLLRDVFGYGFDPGTNIVDVHIMQLRRRIDRPGTPSLIETVRGVGFRLAEREPK
jgi:DNA-binding response OmpR family regulator